MLIKIEKPRFLTSLSKAIGKSAGDWHWYSVLPVKSMICLLIAVGVSYSLPVSFWSKDHQVGAVVVYVGIFILDGFLISVCSRMLIKIYEAISVPGFFSYLVSEDLIHGYEVYVHLIIGIQWVAIFTSGLGIFVLLMNPYLIIYDQIAFAAMIFATAYALNAVFRMAHVMQDLLWQKAINDDVAGKQNVQHVRPERSALHELKN